MESLPAPIRAALEREIGRERRVWAGRPNLATEVLMSFGIYVFAIPWTAFSLFWEAMVIGGLLTTDGGAGAVGSWAGGVMALFGLPFILIGFGMLAAPFLTWRKSGRTVWAVTDRRLLRLTVGGSLEVASWTGRQIKGVVRRERPDGSGDLTVSLGHVRDSDGDRVEKTETLRGVRDVRAVEGAVRGLMERG